MKIIFKSILFFLTVLPLSISFAYATISSTASTVSLQTSCNDASGGILNNCFTDQTLLMDWIKNTRNPTAASSLLVDIGPGTFQRIQWLCNPGEGHVSFRGAGQGRTVFSNSKFLSNAMTFQNCENLTFDSMTVSATFIAVVWQGHGNATWTDVELVGGYASWYETPEDQPTSGAICTSGLNNEHKFFSSSLRLKNPTNGHVIYLNNCGVTWFYGSELVFEDNAGNFTGTITGVKSGGAGHETHLYGSNIRLINGANSAVSKLIAFQSNENAEIHSHGTGIDVISNTSIPITALDANSGGSIHAAESAYVLRTGANGTVTRINNNAGTVHAPHLWAHIPNTDGDATTVDTNFVSANGADQTILTTGTSDGFPHAAIYSTNCPAKARWYDTVDKICRSH